MKRSIFKLGLFVIFASALIFGACKAEEEGEVTSVVFNAGWNLGNTLDAASYGSISNKGLSTETSWGMPMTTQAMIQAVAQKGFKIIRIPVSWHNHITDSSYTIDSAWMARVKTIVDWSLGAGLKVIINIHHDNMAEKQEYAKDRDDKRNYMEIGLNYGFCVPESSTSSYKTTSLNYIKAIWRQVSTTFKDYDENLIFEVLNEPRAVGTSYEWSGSGSNVSNANKIIKEYEQAALDVIRASGGKNATRYVMVAPYAASPSMIEGWSLPRDSTSGKLIVSLHAYTPYRFAMYDGTNHADFTSQDANDVTYLFNSIKSNYISRGIPVIIGEASATNKNNDSARKSWINSYFGKAKALGIPVILWDNMDTNGSNIGERHGWFNRRTLSWYFPNLVNAMLK